MCDISPYGVIGQVENTRLLDVVDEMSRDDWCLQHLKPFPMRVTAIPPPPAPHTAAATTTAVFTSTDTCTGTLHTHRSRSSKTTSTSTNSLSENTLCWKTLQP